VLPVFRRGHPTCRGSWSCGYCFGYTQRNISSSNANRSSSSFCLRKLGISRKDLIESDASQYRETCAWALALHDQYPNAEGLTWTSRQADSARAMMLFEDRRTGSALTPIGTPTVLLLPDGSAILEVLMLAQRLGVLLTP
jgi:hypothetical protein